MRRERGFTLIEVMIVVAIIGILAAIAYPSYQQYVISSNRSAAQQFMLEISSRQQQYMLDARRYGSLTDLQMTLPADVSRVYTVADPALAVTASPPAYTITLMPKAGTVQAGDGSLTLNHIGVKTGNW